MQFLKLCHERNDLRNRQIVQSDEDHHLKEIVQQFINGTACQFIDDLRAEIEEALSETNPVLIAFDVFNVNTYPSMAERIEQFRVLNEHYGETKVDTYENNVTQSPSVISAEDQRVEAEMFLNEFDDMKKQAIEKLKTEARKSLTAQKLMHGNMDEFLRKNQPTPGDIYSAMCHDGCISRYPNSMKLLKLALLIPPTTSEVEHGFSTMNLIVSPLRTSLNDNNVDRLMRTCTDPLTSVMMSLNRW